MVKKVASGDFFENTIAISVCFKTKKLFPNCILSNRAREEFAYNCVHYEPCELWLPKTTGHSRLRCIISRLESKSIDMPMQISHTHEKISRTFLAKHLIKRAVNDIPSE